MAMGVKQHLMGLKQIGPDNKSAAVRQLGVRNLQLSALAPEYRPVLAPVELGSGLIDQSQKMTVAAIAMAEKKVWAHLS